MLKDVAVGDAASAAAGGCLGPQAGFMLKFLSDLKQAASNPSSPLHGKLDFDNMGAAGHSRGGKIAALHYAGR